MSVPGPFVALLAPAFPGGIGIWIGRRASRDHGRGLGDVVVVANVLAIGIGLWWALGVQPHAFGRLDLAPAVASASI